jgi:hypothetical protein
MLSMPVSEPRVAVLLVGNLGLLTALGPSVFRVPQAWGAEVAVAAHRSRLPPDIPALNSPSRPTVTRGCAGHRGPEGSGASPPALPRRHRRVRSTRPDPKRPSTSAESTIESAVLSTVASIAQQPVGHATAHHG